MKLKHGWFNTNGYDELTSTSNNLYIEIKNGIISRKKKLDPKEFGFKVRQENELKGGSARENAFIMKRAFEGETGAIRDNIVLNSANGLLISEKVKTLNQGIKIVESKIDNGLVLNKLLSLIAK